MRDYHFLKVRKDRLRLNESNVPCKNTNLKTNCRKPEPENTLGVCVTFLFDNGLHLKFISQLFVWSFTG